MNPGSPLTNYVKNGDSYNITGAFNGAGALTGASFRTAADPGSCGGGCINASQPGTCGGGCVTAVGDAGKFYLTLKPSMPFSYQPYFNAPTPLISSSALSTVNITPTITFIFDDPGGNMTLENLAEHLAQMQSGEVPTIHLDLGDGLAEEWQPTTESYELELLSESPTMSEWGMLIFMCLAGIVSVYMLRRRRT